jgi:hypothetical protein
MTHAQAMAHINVAGQLWTARSARTWVLDLSMITDAGVTLARPEDPPDRRATADRRLREERQTERPPTPRATLAAPATIPVARQPESVTPSPSPERPPMKPIPVPYRSERRRSWLDRLLNRP